MVSVVDNQNRLEIKQLWAPRAFFVQSFSDLISLRVLSRSLEFTEQALVCLDQDQVRVEVIVPTCSNQVKAITGG